MFQKLYDRVLHWSAHKNAAGYLAVLSAAESSVFPIPPDVMLAPMCLARPKKAWFYAGLCTFSSVLGGMLGYLMGKLAFSVIEPWLLSSSFAEVFEHAVQSFGDHGFWFILLAGFTPIPYKIFTISAGVVGMPALTFLAGSVAGRGGRFFLVAGLIRLGGEKLEQSLRKWIDLIGWSVLVLVAILAVILKLNGSAI
ncbi:MAG: membrane protein YqaA with SNARE-associated domain [Lysobacterales bacterium]|jgi:membrane protein YqaA with SNARE-associated domain